ncbi:lysoplasmalogenase, partial [archaeon]
ALYIASFVVPVSPLREVAAALPPALYLPTSAAVKALPIILLGLYCMATAARAATAGVRSYALLVGVGLLAGSAGDVFLDLRAGNADLFIPGLVSFLIGHVLYIVGYAKCAWQRSAVKAVFFGLFATAMVAYLRPTLPSDLVLPVITYATVIAAMGYSASVRTTLSVNSTQLALLGALSFLISDSVLAVDNFSQPLPYGKLIVMITYYAAQVLTAAAVPLLVSADAAAASKRK